MLEMKITIAAPDLAAALNNLAAALDGKSTSPRAGSAPSEPAEQTVPTAIPVNPTPAPGILPTAAPVTTPPTVNTAPAPAVPTSAPQYTLDMIATAGSALIDSGKMDQLMQLLGKFGVTSLTELAPESYGAVANDLRALGAKI